MSELGLLLLALWLLEGFRWTSLRSVAWSRRPWGRFVPRTPRRPRMKGTRGLLLPEPWAPALERYPSHPWPLAVSPEGISFPRADEEEEVVPWERVEAVRAVGSRVKLDRERIVEGGSPGAARAFVALLHRLARRADEAREAEIRKALGTAFDVRQARGRFRKLRCVLRDARLLAWLTTLNLFVTGPLLGRFLGAGRVWPTWLLLHLALMAFVVTLFVRATRRLPEFAPEGRAEIVTGLVLYPPSTARFLESIFPHAFDGLDPLAVGAVLADRRRLARLVRARLAGLYPDADENPVQGWFRGAVREQVEALAERVGLDREEARAPVVREAGSEAFCPRCGTQYRAGVQTCADCAGVALVTHRDTPDR